MGSFLYDRGIFYSKYSNLTVKDVCSLHNIDSKLLLSDMADWYSLRDQPSVSDLKSIPVDLLIAYLQSMHQRFLWRRLPYMQDLIENLDPLEFNSSDIIKDLKFIFPIFVDDFIHHIHEEEDQLFRNVLEMYAIAKRGKNPGKMFMLTNQKPIHEMAALHHDDDDEMEGIRNLTSNYQLPENSELNLRVIFAELQEFEEELSRHACIENEILFPKAIALQKEVQKKIISTSFLN
ncbi:MAG: hemerythrin domain-containing protein [Cytophagales bacterium]